jgi:hypothetical protein
MKGRVYCIRSHQTPNIYIGSTEQILCMRMAGHRQNYKRFLNNKCTANVTSYEILKYGDAYIELIEEVECETKSQLRAREGHYIRTMDCVNKIIAGRTKEETNKEYYKKNKEHNCQKYAEYRNRDDVITRSKELRQKRVVCECGANIIQYTLKRHLTCTKHLEYLSKKIIS